ncbi:MAG: helix-turn-helix transcriptional regulator [Thermotogaceae bacterium]|jgi:transcriptional regulator with XRE-family HTH domain|nr:helix-turn-helix transcriptional regulator [Thermotogaceae bacterium]
MANKRSSSFGEFLEQIAKTYNVEDSLAIGRIKGQVASQLMSYRKERGLSQKQLGELLGFKQPYVSNIERGEENLSLETLVKISACLEGRLNVDLGITDRKTEITKEVIKYVPLYIPVISVQNNESSFCWKPSEAA